MVLTVFVKQNETKNSPKTPNRTVFRFHAAVIQHFFVFMVVVSFFSFLLHQNIFLYIYTLRVSLYKVTVRGIFV